MFKNKELFRVVMIFVIGIILILMTLILFKSCDGTIFKINRPLLYVES